LRRLGDGQTSDSVVLHKRPLERIGAPAAQRLPLSWAITGDYDLSPMKAELDERE